MNVHAPITRHLIRTFFLTLTAPVLLNAQLIALKSVPVAAGDQFVVLPSENLGMGSTAIAMDDKMLDPFINPAKGMRSSALQLFSAPTFYSISDNNGSARSLPLGLLFGKTTWFGGMSMAIQQLQAPKPPGFTVWPANNISQFTLRDQSANNMYFSGLVGRTFSDRELAVAAGISWSNLQAVDGVELLYANSEKIEQFGDMLDVRIGLLQESRSNQIFEAVLIHNRFDMTHDVTYPAWFAQRMRNVQSDERHVERNLDQARTWGCHFGYVQPMSSANWRVGAVVTANRKTHPKIPNYDIMNIPRDPGDTWGFNFGTGVARTHGEAVFAADLIFEPIWSNTWADAAVPITTVSGALIPAGGKTITNDFQFSNWLLRIGIARQQKIFGFQLGLQVRFINYHLDQVNKIEEFERSQNEDWAEWTPSIGFNLNFPEFQIHYNGRLTSGTGRPGTARDWQVWSEDFARAALNADFIVAPSGALTLQDALVMTHQVYITIPLQ
jgi:hypothetical protein